MTKNNCKAKDPNNCRFHGTGRFEEAAQDAGLTSREARIAYLTTPAGIQELKDKGKHEIAAKFEARRLRLEKKAAQAAKAGKKPIRLALDVDETSGGFIDALRLSVAEQRGLSPEEMEKTFPEPEHYNLVKSGWFNDLPHFLEEFHEAERNGVYRKMKAFAGMSRTLRTLVSNGDVEVHVVTAREPAWNDDTRYWLRKHRVPFSSITHTEDKENVKHVDVFIDDSDKQLSTLQNNNRTVIAFDNRYNRHVETTHRVKTWAEVPAVLKVIAEARS